MDKIHINLNPRKPKGQNETLEKIAGYSPFVGLAAAGVFVLIFILYLIVFVRGGICRGYERKWSQWEEKFNVMNQIKIEGQKIKAEKDALEKVATSRNQMADILSDVFEVLPKNIWFKSLNFREEKFSLEGYVAAWKEDYLVSLVDKFINPLKAKPYFSSKFGKVNLKESKRDNFYGVEVLYFNIECES